MEPTLSEKNGENIMQMSFNPILFLLEFSEARIYLLSGTSFLIKVYIYIYIYIYILDRSFHCINYGRMNKFL